MFRKVLGLVAFVPVLVAAGCGGYSQETAEKFCGQEAAAKQACTTDEATQACIDCYMECGDECRAQATCPETYACPIE
jgi:hypothetical protein